MRYTSIARIAIAASAVLLAGAGCMAKDTYVNTNAAVNTGTTVNTNAAVNVNANANVSAGAGGTMLDMRIAGNAIIVGEQRPAKTVKVELVELDKGAFVVVREDNYASGNVLSTSGLLKAGSNTNLTLNLSRDSVDGETLYVTAYADDGDGVFDNGDMIMLDGTGNQMYAEFGINKDASEDPLLPRI